MRRHPSGEKGQEKESNQTKKTALVSDTEVIQMDMDDSSAGAGIDDRDIGAAANVNPPAPAPADSEEGKTLEYLTPPPLRSTPKSQQLRAAKGDMTSITLDLNLDEMEVETLPTQPPPSLKKGKVPVPGRSAGHRLGGGQGHEEGEPHERHSHPSGEPAPLSSSPLAVTSAPAPADGVVPSSQPSERLQRQPSSGGRRVPSSRSPSPLKTNAKSLTAHPTLALKGRASIHAETAPLAVEALEQNIRNLLGKRKSDADVDSGAGGGGGNGKRMKFGKKRVSCSYLSISSCFFCANGTDWLTD
jgi:hypothetical protein